MFYGVSVEQIGKKVSYREAVLLTSMLMRNPQSWLAAAVAGWEYPVTNEWMVLAHTYDLLAQANFTKSKPKPYPKPWKTQNKERLGARLRQPAEVVLAKLRKMNPNMEM